MVPRPVWEFVRLPETLRLTSRRLTVHHAEGIFEALDLNARAADTNLQGNLHDLEVLMTKAKEMVEFASSLNAKLTIQEEELERRRAMFPGLPASSKATQPEEATFIRSSLAQLGLPTVAVTQDMVNDGDQYHEELAKELAGVLTGRNAKGRALMGSGEGIIGLDEVWCGWNRARGIGELPAHPKITQWLTQWHNFSPDTTSISLDGCHVPPQIHGTSDHTPSIPIWIACPAYPKVQRRSIRKSTQGLVTAFTAPLGNHC